MWAPMPREEPVTMAILFCSFIIEFSFCSGRNADAVARSVRARQAQARVKLHPKVSRLRWLEALHSVDGVLGLLEANPMELSVDLDGLDL